MGKEMSNFNQQKNLKAGTYTVLLLGSLLALCFVISWTSPVTPPIQEEEGMEVKRDVEGRKKGGRKRG
jgi:hypothetical protein